MPFRTIGSQVQTLNYQATTTFTADADGFVCGIARCNSGSDGECYFKVGGAYCGGFIHTPAGLASYLGMGVCFPVKAGQSVTVNITNGSFSGGLFEAI